jgi:hypothetical protein
MKCRELFPQFSQSHRNQWLAVSMSERHQQAAKLMQNRDNRSAAVPRDRAIRVDCLCTLGSSRTGATLFDSSPMCVILVVFSAAANTRNATLRTVLEPLAKTVLKSLIK